MAHGGTATAAAAQAEGGGRGAGDRMEGGFWGRGSVSRPGGVEVAGRGAPNAGVRPPRDRRWMGRGGRRAWEREGRLGRKGGGVGPAAPVPLSIFFEFVFSISF